MPEFGDELIVESYKVPWLIWIQLLVTILLTFILFSGFSIFNSDPSGSATASPSTLSSAAGAAPPTHLNKPSSSRRRTKAEGQRVRRDEETRQELVREDDDDSSMKESIFSKIFRYSNHPCNFIAQAKRALFKCFGLDSQSEISTR